MYELYNRQNKKVSIEEQAQATASRFMQMVSDGFASCTYKENYVVALVDCFDHMPLDIQVAYGNMIKMVEYGSNPQLIALYIAHDMRFRSIAESATAKGKPYFSDKMQNILAGICTQLEREITDSARNFGLLGLHRRRPE